MRRDILYKFFEGKASPKEQRLIGQWLDESEKHKEVLVRERMVFDAMIVSGGITDRQSVQSRKKRTRVVFMELLRVAAVILVMFLVGGYIYVRKMEEIRLANNIVTVPVGQRVNLQLPDGTSVWLNASSEIIYPAYFSGSTREIHLNGEAYFEVSKNSHRPFIVDLDKASIRVTGTSFHLQAYACEPDITVELDEGQVDLLYGDRQEYSLRPGESLIYNKVKNACILQLQEGVSGLIRWKEQEIDFRNTPMKEVLKELDLHYGVPFCVGDTVVYQYSYTFCVKKASLEEVMKTLEIISPVRFQKGDTIRVRMK